MPTPTIFPHQYLGPTADLGRFGITRKGAVVWLTSQERDYVAQHSRSTYKPITSDEAKKLGSAAPTSPQDEVPSSDGNPATTAGAPKAADTAVYKMEVEAKVEDLIETYKQNELIDLLRQRSLPGNATESKKILAERLAPVLVNEDRKAAGAPAGEDADPGAVVDEAGGED